MPSFEGWWDKYEIRPYGPIETRDVEAAYIAGFDACRDKWGGLTYKETMEDEKDIDDCKQMAND